MKGFLLLMFCLHFSAYATASECNDGKNCTHATKKQSVNSTTSKRINLTLDNKVVIGKYTVSAEFLNIREAPSTNAAISGQLKQGDHVLVLSSKKNWKMIQVNKTFGWVSARYISLSQ